MWKVIKWLFTTLFTVSVGFAIFILQQWLLDKPLPNLPRFLSFFVANWHVLVAAVITMGLIALTSFQRDALRNLEKHVWFYKSTARLKPSDINPSRFWYDPFFLKRPALDRAVNHFATGQGVLLLGVPLLGKTRSVYEILKRLRGYMVLCPSPDKLDVGDIKLPRFRLLLKPRVILFLDDIPQYVGKFSPTHLHYHLSKQSKSVTVLATCRLGKDFSEVQNDQAFDSFINQNLEAVYLEELTNDEEKKVAKHFKRPWEENRYNRTPGSIVFGLDAMQRLLQAASVEAGTLMRSLNMLHEVGIRSYRRVLVERAAKEIYELDAARHELDQAWFWLRKSGFVALEKELVVPTHEVYIESSFSPAYALGDMAADVNGLISLFVNADDHRDVFNMAVELDKRGDYSKAEATMRKFLELAPDQFVASGHLVLGSLFYKQDRKEEAVKELREAIRLDPDFTDAHLILGLEFIQRGNMQEAEKELREAIRIEPDNSQAHFYLSISLYMQGYVEESEKELRETIRVDPHYVDAHYELGLLLKQHGRLEEAEKELREAIRLNPTHDDARSELATLLFKPESLEQAETEFRAAIDSDPNNAEAHYNYGVFLSDQERIGEAGKEYRIAIRLNPDHSSAHYNLGVLLFYEGRFQEAEDEWREAIRSDTDSAPTHYSLAVLLYEQERFEEAEVEYLEAIRCNPDLVHVHSDYGALLGLLGRTEEAEKEFREAIRCKSDYAEAHYNLGVLYYLQGHMEEAEQSFRQASRYTVSPALKHYDQGVMLRTQGRTQEARMELRKAKRIIEEEQRYNK